MGKIKGMMFRVINGCLDVQGVWPTSANGALRESIKKWETLAEYHEKTKADYPPDNIYDESCALCHLFYLDVPEADVCIKCPVALILGKKHCVGTPFFTYEENVATDWGELAKDARDMVDVLKLVQKEWDRRTK